MNRSRVQWRGSYIDDSEWRHTDKDVEDRICDIRVGERAYEHCKKKTGAVSLAYTSTRLHPVSQQHISHVQSTPSTLV